MTAGPVFQEAWQAQAFAMATLLQEQGYVTPREWTEALGCEIAAARDRGELDDGANYYHDWLTALEKTVAQKGLISAEELARRKVEWEVAAHATPHGMPIELKR